MLMKPLFLRITTLVVIVFSLAMPLNKVRADDGCKLGEQQYGIIQTILNKLDIRRTVTNMFSSLITDSVLTTVVHADPDQLARCAKWAELPANGGAVFPVDVSAALATCAPLTDDDTYKCSSLFNTYSQPQVVAAIGGYTYPYKRNITNGSLLGLAYSLEKSLKEPLPVNLAFFIQDEIKNVPFLNKAFAAKYNAPLLDNTSMENVILSLWKLFRNLAYGLMSLFLIVIGIMMIMRKKVDQQTVVSVQYALPKIIMILILIPFSYPIGATFATFAWTAQDTARSLVTTAITSSFGGTTWTPQSVALATSVGYILVAILALAIPVVGILITAIIALLAIVIICLFLWLYIKIFIIYFKLIAGLILSPMVFVVGSIPGNESKISDWFKMTLAQALSVPAMAAVSTTGLLITTVLTKGTSSNVGTAFLGLLMAPALAILSLYYASKMPEKIEAAIVGEPKKARR